MYSFRLNIVADILSRVTPAGSSLGYEINRLFRFARGSILTCNKRVPHNSQVSWLTMHNGLLPHILCVFMRATSCHLIIVFPFCSVLLLVCRGVLFVSLFRNTCFVSQCGVCVDTETCKLPRFSNSNRLWAQFTVPLLSVTTKQWLAATVNTHKGHSKKTYKRVLHNVEGSNLELLPFIYIFISGFHKLVIACVLSA